MHSSRMRTVRGSGRLLGGGVCSWGVGVCSRGVSALGGLLWGVSAPGGCLLPGRGVSALGVSALGRLCLLRGGCVSHHALRQTPPVNRQTPVKT